MGLQFGKWISAYRKETAGGLTEDQFYATLLDQAEKDLRSNKKLGKEHLIAVSLEGVWAMFGRPYYNIYPCILEMCERLSDKVQAQAFKLPESVGRVSSNPKFGETRVAVLELRLPLGNSIESILLGVADARVDERGVWSQEIMLCCLKSEYMLVSNWTWGEKWTVGEIFRTLRSKDDLYWSEDVNRVVRLVFCLSLLTDPELDFLTRDVCSRDIGKPPTEAVLRRAQARKGLGWDLGRTLEGTPHTRRPHFAVRWMGKGRTKQVIRPIKGSVVRRHKLEKLPSGFASKEENSD